MMTYSWETCSNWWEVADSLVVHHLYYVDEQKFRSKKMDNGELGCVERCAEKYIKLTSRAGFRFAEHQAAQQGMGPSG